MTRITKMTGSSASMKASAFNTVSLSLSETCPEPKGKHRFRRDEQLAKGIQKTAKDTANSAINTPADARRARRLRRKEHNSTCFACREKGHSMLNCPVKKSTATKCFRCGSFEHALSKCSIKDSGELPFAECFVCKASGHLSGQCPENPTGLYPSGGGCSFCGSVRHLAKDCRPLAQTEGNITLGTMRIDDAGDDDDVFGAVHRINAAQNHAKVNKAKVATKKMVVF